MPVDPSSCRRPGGLAGPRAHARFAALAAATLVGAAAGSTGWTLTVDPAASSTTGSGTVGSDLSGFLIGNLDPVTNPGGTRTLPGVFGGSGNQPVDLDLGLSIDGELAGQPAGTLRIEGDPASGGVLATDLALDLLGASTPAFGITASILFDTFRTFSPDSLFPGGIPVDVPLGTATADRLEAVQLGPAALTATPAGTDVWLLTGSVPVLLVGEFTALDQILPLPPVPVDLAVTATFTILPDGGGTLAWTGGLTFNEVDTGPFTEPLIDAAPFDLPTVLPPGGTAGLLVTATPSSVSTALEVAATLAASGPADPTPLAGDVDGDGVVGFADVLLVLASFGPCPDAPRPCPADLDDDTAVAFGDLLIVLANWTS